MPTQRAGSLVDRKAAKIPTVGDLRLSNTQGSDRWYTKKPSQYENHNKGEIGVGQEVPSWSLKNSAIRQCLVLSIGQSFTRSRRARPGEVDALSAYVSGRILRVFGVLGREKFTSLRHSVK